MTKTSRITLAMITTALAVFMLAPRLAQADGWGDCGCADELTECYQCNGGVDYFDCGESTNDPNTCWAICVCNLAP